ncbi:MAG: hypothetical protein ACWGNB_07510 [Thiogranum sp.]
MISSLPDTVREHQRALCAFFDTPLRLIAQRAVRVWFNRERLDQVLSEHVYLCSYYDLIYAIDIDGHQISSNVHADSVDRRACGQDLSRRPYSVNLAVLNNAAFAGVFLCDTYISQVTQRPCVTLMCGVTSGLTPLGFIAADIDPAYLPPV